ncbi:MAG: enoyl-CoA hydratase [Candidatus Lambdaproteobacteria bacterium]|nr:enoyl-CoA hydratase [Candidatus Lambdaproteobacteria bacterium]
MTAYENLRLEIEARIATVTLDPRDPAEALDAATIAEIVAVCDEVQRSPAVSVLLLTGIVRPPGGKEASAALERRLDPERHRPMRVALACREEFHRVPRAFYDLDVPVIAAVGDAVGAAGPEGAAGAAAGMGSNAMADLALFCEIRIATPGARFGESFGALGAGAGAVSGALSGAELGTVPGDGGPWFLVRELGYQRAAYLTLTAGAIDGATAQRLRLVHRLVPPERLLPEARGIAEIIAAKPPAALRLTKRLLREAERTELSPFLAMSGMAQGLALSTEDHREALAARAEDRPPRFTGR